MHMASMLFGELTSADIAKIAKMKPLERALRAEIRKHKNAVLEGHLACEFGLPADFVFITRTHPTTLEKRLRARGYSEQKVEENAMAELLDYCEICVRENYGMEKRMWYCDIQPWVQYSVNPASLSQCVGNYYQR